MYKNLTFYNQNCTRHRIEPAIFNLVDFYTHMIMDDPKVEGLALFTRKNGNFLYRDEGDQQKLSKRSINLLGQGHSHFFSLTADNFRYNQNNTLSVKTQLPQRHE